MADLPWRTSPTGVSVSLRVTPRGGRDDIDAIETLGDGKSVLKVRVRAVAEGGEANRAVTELLAGALGVPTWNFHKILIGRDGRIIEWFTAAGGMGPKLDRAIEAALGAQS